MSKQRFASVWDAIEDTAEEAENMKLRSVLMVALDALNVSADGGEVFSAAVDTPPVTIDTTAATITMLNVISQLFRCLIILLLIL